MKVHLRILSLSVLAAAALFCSCKGTGSGKSSYQTVTVSPGSLSTTVTATGTIEPINQVEVGAQVSGIISNIYVDYNTVVKQGQLMAEIGEREFAFHCYGSDISQAAIDIALENIRSAGLMKYIDLKVKPFQQYTEAPKPGILVTNPPYGERISSRDLLGLYNMIGERLKHVFMGYKAWILSYKDECFDKIGLRPSEKIKLMNGSLECEYRCYELFEGTNKN